MRTAYTTMIGFFLLGASIPGIGRGEMLSGWKVCELRSVNRGTSLAAGCLACHDGSAATPVATGHGSHPVDVSYAAALAGRHGLRPAAEIERRNFVLAFGKTVTCTTCHDGRSRLHAHTSSPNLCSGCHDR